MKKITALLLAIITMFTLASCSMGASESDAVDVIKTFAKAVEEHDTEKMQECIDPSSTAVSKGLVDSLGNMFGISGAYDMGIGAGGLLGYASEEALGIDYSLKYKDVLKNNLGENSGDITVRFELTVKNKESGEKVSEDIMWTFKMVKKDKQWYIFSYDEPELIKSEEEMEEQLEYNSVGSVVQDIDEAFDFSDGVAWVRVGEYDELTYYCVDTTGKILFALEKGWKPYGDSYEKNRAFANGHSVVVDTNTYNQYFYYIVNKKGEIVNDFKDGDVQFEVEDVFENGYIMLGGTYSDIYGSVTKNGLMNINGEWVIEPADEIYRINYSGGNIFSLAYESDINTSVYFNVKTKQTFEVKITPEGYEWEKNINNLQFNDGYAVFQERGYIYRVSEDGVVEKLFSPFNGNGYISIGKYDSGLIYVADSEYSPESCGFYDTNGNVVIDLTEYNTSFNAEEMYFKDGYAAFEVNNYCMFVDKNGNNVFEPKKIANSKIFFEDGILRISTENGVEFYDTNGNLLFGKIEGIDEMPEHFSEGLGIARVYSSGYHYIDKTGNIVF